MTPAPSRRRVLQYGAFGTAMLGLAGCRAVTDSRRFRSSYTPTIADPGETVLAEGPTLAEGPPFFATLLTAPEEEQEQLDAAVLPEAKRAAWTDIDYETYFVAVVISRLDMTHVDVRSTTVDGSTYAVRFESDGWPPMADEELFTRLEKWQLNGGEPPDRATVRVDFGEPADG